MTRFSALFLALFLLFGPVAEARGQAESSQKGGVGLVLSGGGAKGLYHIGVIEALEERGVPIDYVAGTSMGSIIAAMYASGYSPAEMRQIVLSGQIQEWVSGRIDPSKCKPYYRQLGNSPSFINLWLDLSDEDKKFRMPSSLISSTQVDMALLQLFTPASTAAD
ncbi:MAG: patatin-like phospholipase family protein, partial [Alistipes sp.]|nr:patatin-like phospholipase family protein [Alistipes sp.]